MNRFLAVTFFVAALSLVSFTLTAGAALADGNLAQGSDLLPGGGGNPDCEKADDCVEEGTFSGVYGDDEPDECLGRLEAEQGHGSPVGQQCAQHEAFAGSVTASWSPRTRKVAYTATLENSYFLFATAEVDVTQESSVGTRTIRVHLAPDTDDKNGIGSRTINLATGRSYRMTGFRVILVSAIDPVTFEVVPGRVRIVNLPPTRWYRVP